MDEVTALVLTVNVAPVAPAATTTLAETVAADDCSAARSWPAESYSAGGGSTTDDTCKDQGRSVDTT